MLDALESMRGFILMSKDEMFAVMLIFAAVLIFTNLFEKLVFWMYNHITNAKVQEVLRSLIYELDEFADDMDNQAKRDAAINKLQNILRYKIIIMPKFLLGWIIDMQVREIRALQASSTKDADLHK